MGHRRIIPEKGNLIPAWGAALAENNEESIHLSNLIQVIENKLSVTSPFQSDLSPIFDSEEEYRSWKKEKDQYKINMPVCVPDYRKLLYFL